MRHSKITSHRQISTAAMRCAHTNMHDDSDTYSDNIVLTTTDGVHDAEFLLCVTVDPEDDETPVDNVNTGLDT